MRQIGSGQKVEIIIIKEIEKLIQKCLQNNEINESINVDISQSQKKKKKGNILGKIGSWLLVNTLKRYK
jgi:hypothetical protein